MASVAVHSQLSAKYPEYFRDGVPSKRMLTDAVTILLSQSGAQGLTNKVLSASVKLCERARGSEPWFFLAHGPKSLKALRLLLDRVVASEDSQLSAWLAPFKPSEVSQSWFDGSLLMNKLPRNIVLRVAELFLIEGQGGCAILTLAVCLLRMVCSDLGSETLTDETKREACETICERITQNTALSESLLNALNGKDATGLHSLVLKRNALRHESLLRSPSVLPIQVLDSRRARTLVEEVEWIGFDMDFTLIDFDEQARLTQLWSCVRSAMDETLKTMNKMEPVPPRIENALKLCEHLPPPGLFPKWCVLDLAGGNIFRQDQDGYVDLGSVFHGTNRLTGGALLQTSYESMCLDLPLIGGEKNRFVLIHTDMEMPLALAFAKCVDLVDEQGGAYTSDEDRERVYGTLMDILTKSFVLAQNPFFQSGLHNVYLDKTKLGKMLKDQSATTKRWLRKLRKQQNKRLFLLSDAKEEHVTMMMSSAYGGDWVSLFDLIVVDAKKSKYFDDHGEQTGNYSAQKINRGGHVSDFVAFTRTMQPNKADSTVFYFGDHPVKDVMLPSKVPQWKTVAVVADLTKDLPSSSPRSSMFAKMMSRQSSSSSSIGSDSASSRSLILRAMSLSRTSSSSKAPLSALASMGSCFVCEDGTPTLLSKQLQVHAQFCVPSLRYCANENMFI